MGRGWELVVAGYHKRKVNGNLGLLCRLHFPGLILISGNLVVAITWEHYIAALDQLDREGRIYDNKVAQVVAEL